MAAEAITPVDEIGMPLPLALPERRGLCLDHLKTDEHHPFHPKKSPVLTRSLGGRAVRASRLQTTEWHQHHSDYHGHYCGPPLPDTRRQQFAIVVLATAGYVPNRAIAFDGGEPEIVPLTKKQRQLMWDRGDFKVASPDTVHNFLIDYTVHQDLVEVDERLIDEFLNTPNKHKRHSLGGTLLNLAIEQATEPIDPLYRQAWKKNQIHRNSSSSIRRLIKCRLQSRHKRSVLIDRLEQALVV